MKKTNAHPLFFQKKVVGNFESTKNTKAVTSRWCNLFGF